MLDGIKREVTQILINVQVRSEEQVAAAERAAEEAAASAARNVQYHHADYNEALGGADDGAQGAAGAAGSEAAPQPFVRDGVKIGRNDPCWCGSGKKFKQCHGKLS